MQVGNRNLRLHVPNNSTNIIDGKALPPGKTGTYIYFYYEVEILLHVSIFFNEDLSIEINKEIKKIDIINITNFFNRKFCKHLDEFVALKQVFLK